MGLPASPGAISNTSRSAVGREKLYTMLNDEPSHANQTDFLTHCRIQFAQKKEPRFRNALIRMHRQDFLPSCRSGDSSVPRMASAVLAAMLSQLGSLSRGRRYLRAQVGHSLKPPNTTEAFSSARSLSCLPILLSPERGQILIGFAGRAI